MSRKEHIQSRMFRKSNWRSTLLGGGLAFAALGLGLLARGWFVQSTAEARVGMGAPIGSSQQEVLAGEEAGLTSAGAGERDIRQSQIVEGIEITATNIRRQGNQVLADMCFDIPDGSDWTIWKASLVYPEGTIDSFGLTLIERRDPSVNGEQQVVRLASGTKEVSVVKVEGDVPGRRCDTVYFDGTEKVTGPGVTIQIMAVAAQPREGETCSAANLAKVQRAVESRSPGIVVACESGDGYEGVTLAGWPSALSRAQAEEILYGEDLFLDVYGRRGPWVFIVDGP